ncbi:MAG TPA: glycoside hydrolase family 32 protein [Prolixibacteraceae bacterium]|nr:glycoside hydrolase family 32 protein [Bacteroidales bacterium]HNQ36817.1 glycoside hydrolase family 32 protein [Prolixibacteraceae bacterium]HRV87807.1 glycoside hydrolase family 32 protein [Prolixibacteraceae bacterium]
MKKHDMRRSMVAALVLAGWVLMGFGPARVYYNEKYRPQFHFTPERNYMGYPAGGVFLDGRYHLFYQCNPRGNEAGFHHWGHAVSRDLMTWEHRPLSVFPDNLSEDKEACTALPGSVVVDRENLLGYQKGDTPVLVAFYTSQGCGQRIAWSNDGGDTWQKYSGNPVLPYDETDQARYPKVLFHQPTGQWVMILHRKPDQDDRKQGFSFYTSKNLRDWEFRSHLAGFTGRPDLVELRLNNRPDDTRWIIIDGNGDYVVGSFDGSSFTAESIRMKCDYGRGFAGATTFSNLPAGEERTVQVALLNSEEWPGMPFHGQLAIPAELTLRKAGTGIYLFRNPVSEIEQLQGKSLSWKNEKLIPGIGQNLVKKAEGDCVRIRGRFDLKNCESFGFMLRAGKKNEGTELVYNVKRGTLSLMGQTIPLEPVDHKITLDILIDRASVEVFANNGKAALSSVLFTGENDRSYILYNTGGEIVVDELEITPLRSVWANGE